MKLKITIALLISITFSSAFAEVVEYENNYKGIKTGKSTLSDVVETFDAPIGKKLYSNNVKYKYPKFHVSIQDSTGRINTIIVFDKSYIDPNGISVGVTEQSLENILNVKVANNTATDKSKGIIYWLFDGSVSKIVLVHKLFN